jgi:hypothetical protein
MSREDHRWHDLDHGGHSGYYKEERLREKEKARTELNEEQTYNIESYQEQDDYDEDDLSQIELSRKSVWYFVCSYGRSAIHVQHETSTREEAEHKAGELFLYGVTIEGDSVDFDQVICVSENHEICYHVTNTE